MAERIFDFSVATRSGRLFRHLGEIGVMRKALQCIGG